MSIRTLVSSVGTTVSQVVRGLLHHLLPVDEPVSPEEAVREAVATLKEIGVAGPQLCIISHVFKVARDTCGSPALLKAAVAAFDAAAALEEIGMKAEPLEAVYDESIEKEEWYNYMGPGIVFREMYECWDREVAALTEQIHSAPRAKKAAASTRSEPADARSAAAALFKSATVLEDTYVSAPVLRAMAGVFNVAKDSRDPAAVLKVAAAGFSAAAREELQKTNFGFFRELRKTKTKRRAAVEHLQNPYNYLGYVSLRIHGNMWC